MGDPAELDTVEALARLEGETLATWSENKKHGYCHLIEKRTRAARYILLRTSEIILKKARERRFISDKHLRQLFPPSGHVDYDYHQLLDKDGPKENHYHFRHDRENPGMIGGRSPHALGEIANTRADTVLANLPPLAKAVSVIDPETSAKLRRIEKLKKDAEPLKEQLDELSETIQMSELDQSMTIGAFRAMVATREQQRGALVTKINAMSKEAYELETVVAKALYAGLPGLSEAIVETVRTYHEQCKALDSSMRRIEEQVLYGDSETALKVLRQFEQDEAVISESVAVRFRAALEQLKLSVNKARKVRTKRALAS